jgi:chromosome partitioning protein
MIIAVLHQKGGVGKTTLALHVAAGLALQGARVLLVDADPQGSARDWAAARQTEALFPVVALDRPTLHRDLPAVAADYDHTVIDGPPRATDLTRSAILAAQVVLVPVQPSPLDVWSCDQIVTLVKEASVYTDKLISVFVVNRKIVGTAIARDVTQALAAFDVPVLSSQIAQRVAFAEALATGLTVFETVPQSAAAQEMTALVQELMELRR